MTRLEIVLKIMELSDKWRLYDYWALVDECRFGDNKLLDEPLRGLCSISPMFEELVTHPEFWVPYLDGKRRSFVERGEEWVR